MRILMQRRMRKDKGQNLLEFALVIPILTIIVLGIFDFGWILHRQLTMDHATRAGARRGAVGVTTDDIKLRVVEAVYFPLTPEDVNVMVLDPNHIDTGDPDNRTPDNYIVVEVILNDVPLITPLRNFIDALGPINLSSRAEFLIE